jgi:hypothetical protein
MTHQSTDPPPADVRAAAARLSDALQADEVRRTTSAGAQWRAGHAAVDAIDAAVAALQAWRARLAEELHADWVEYVAQSLDLVDERRAAAAPDRAASRWAADREDPVDATPDPPHVEGWPLGSNGTGGAR